jgi:hypothetical protein
MPAPAAVISATLSWNRMARMLSSTAAVCKPANRLLVPPPPRIL